MPWPDSVLICQRSNAVWAKRQHASYAQFLSVVAVLWGLVGIVVAIVHRASLADYLTTVALPSFPALLDATELARRHRKDAARRQLIEAESDRLLAVKSASADHLRELQDQLYELRREAPLVPEWYYNLLVRGYERDMRYAAEQRASGRKDGDDHTAGV
jgi:hypothetical protein